MHDVHMSTTRVPVPAARALQRADIEGQFEPLRGRRAALSNEKGSVYDWRVVSELILSEGHVAVYVLPEEDYWRHRLLGTQVSPVRWPAGAVWVE